nr:unnamed protein product [Callosobruchus analis]
MDSWLAKFNKSNQKESSRKSSECDSSHPSTSRFLCEGEPNEKLEADQHHSETDTNDFVSDASLPSLAKNQKLMKEVIKEKKKALVSAWSDLQVFKNWLQKLEKLTVDANDLAYCKQFDFTVICFGREKNRVITQFFDLIEPVGSTAVNLYSALKKSVVSKHIPLENMVGFSSDTCNVMIGENNSLFSHLKEDISNMFVFCAPTMYLTVARLKYIKFYRYPHHDGFLVLELYEPLEAYISESLFEDISVTTENMLVTMKNSFTKIYLEFMSYSLGLMTDFNLLFQSEKPLLHKLKS